MSAITTHVLDTARGKPAAGVPVRLEFRQGSGEWKLLGEGVTNADGRLTSLLPQGIALTLGSYRLTFDAGSYHPGFYPEITVAFRVDDPSQHYHVPLLLSPFGYSTYRGT